MTTLRQICVAAILTFTLAVSVFAGEIDCPGVVAPSPPPPPPPAATVPSTITMNVIMAIFGLIK